MTKNSRIDSLTSLRAFAALGVFLSHLGFLKHSENKYISGSFEYFNLGYSGVSFFFILSGFIITYSFIKKSAFKKIEFSEFIYGRVARIYPVHLLCLSIFLLSYFYFEGLKGVSAQSLISNASLLQSFSTSRDDYFSFNSVSWSLSVEMVFYSSFFILISLNNSILIYISSLLIALAIYSASSGFVSPVFSHWFFYINPILRIPDFIIGIILCRLYLKVKFHPGFGVLTLLEVFSLTLVLSTFYSVANGFTSGGIKFDIVFIPSMAFMIFVFSFNGGVISKLISNRFFILAGESSFSFYLIHAIVIGITERYINPSMLSDEKLLLYVLFLLLICSLSGVAIYKFFEKPVYAALRTRSLKPHKERG